MSGVFFLACRKKKVYTVKGYRKNRWVFVVDTEDGTATYGMATKYQREIWVKSIILVYQSTQSHSNDVVYLCLYLPQVARPIFVVCGVKQVNWGGG